MTIRLLGQEDAEKFLSARLEALEESPLAFGATYEEWKVRDIGVVREKFVKEWSSPQNVIFGALAEERIVGMLGVRQNFPKKKAHKMTIWGMYVSPTYRKRGVGRELMKRAIEYARGIEGIERLELVVVSTNKAAINLYTSFGFKIWGEEPDAMKVNGEYISEDHMSLPLREDK